MSPALPVLLMVAGLALACWGYAPRRRRPAAPVRYVPARAVARLVWDLLAGLVKLAAFACFVFAPRRGGGGRR